MMLLVPVAFAGLLDTFTDEERQVAICQQAAAPAEALHDYARAAGVWEACAAEARRAGHSGAVTMLEDQLALTKARAKAASFRTSDPNRYALDVLAVAADQASTFYPGTDVADIFRAWMATEPGKQRLRVLPPMRLDDTDDHVDALALPRLRRLQHHVGLADARRRADEDAKPPARTRLARRRLEERIGRWPQEGLGPVVGHARQSSISPAPPLRATASFRGRRAPGLAPAR